MKFNDTWWTLPSLLCWVLPPKTLATEPSTRPRMWYWCWDLVGQSRWRKPHEPTVNRLQGVSYLALRYTAPEYPPTLQKAMFKSHSAAHFTREIPPGRSRQQTSRLLIAASQSCYPKTDLQWRAAGSSRQA